MTLATVPVHVQVDWLSLWMKTGWLDIVFLVAFAIGVFLGLQRGLSKILPHLIEVLVAQVVTIEYSKGLAQILAARFQIPVLILHIVLFAALAVASILLVRILFQLLMLIATMDFKSPISGVAGAILSGAHFVLFLSLVSTFAVLIPLPFIQHTFTDRSLSGSFLIQLSGQVHDYFVKFLPAVWQIK